MKNGRERDNRAGGKPRNFKSDRRNEGTERPARQVRPEKSTRQERPVRQERSARQERPVRQEHPARQERLKRPGWENFEEGLRLEGRNAVLEALNHDKPIDKILVKKGEIEGTLRVIVAKAKDKGIMVQEVSKQKLDEMAQSGNHQGVMAMCPAHEYAEISDILDRATAKGEEPFIVILDSITDTHNLGAIIRSAEAAGAHGVIIPKHRAAGLTGIVSKTAAGALEHVLVAKVVNIGRAIQELQQKGLWVAVGDINGHNLYKAPLEGPIAIVIGGEGEGAGRLIKEKCDFTIKIPMRGKLTSLNASVAAGILMYEVVRRRHYSN